MQDPKPEEVVAHEEESLADAIARITSQHISAAYDAGYQSGFMEGERVKQGNIRVSVRIMARNRVHSSLSIWVNGGCITAPGLITLRNEEVEPFIARLSPNLVESE